MLQANDVVLLTKRVNSEWLQGRVDNREGIFPASFVDIQVPLTEDKNIVVALYDFRGQMAGDLDIKAGQAIRVTRKISADWLYGECDGRQGQFPTNYVDRVPDSI